MGEKHEKARVAEFYSIASEFWKTARDQPKSGVSRAKLLPRSHLGQARHIWLAAPGKKGQPHKDGNLRRFLPEYKPLADYKMGWLDEYFENWSSLEAAASR